LEFFLGAAHDDEVTRCNSTVTSQNLETSDVEDDISVGDNRSETSSPKRLDYTETFHKKVDSDENGCLSPAEFSSNRISNSNYNSPFKEDEEFENRTEEPLKFYDSGIFHLYRPDRDSKEENEGGSAFGRMGGSLPSSIYGRSMDLTKSSFQSQLLAGFAASVIAGNTQRESQDTSGIYFGLNVFIRTVGN
jgi:hypothetical protein